MALDPVKPAEQQLRDRERKLSAVSVLMRSATRARIMGDPLSEFFGAAEVWETVVPVDPPFMSCQSGCMTSFIQSSNACRVWPEGSKERADCLMAADAALQQCLGYC